MVCMYLCLGTMCAQEGQQRVSDPVSLEPQQGVSCDVVLRSLGPLEEQAKLFATVFSLQLSACFLIESQSVQSLSRGREGCRLSLDCWSYVTWNCGLQRGMPCMLDFYRYNKIPVIISSDKGKRVILAQSF